MNDPTGNKAITNIMRRRKSERGANSQRRRNGDRAARAARGMGV